MSKVYIGAGGWAYFRIPGMDSLAAYAKAFDFVEVNSTFYTTPSIQMVRSWRRRGGAFQMISCSLYDAIKTSRINTCYPLGRRVMRSSISRFAFAAS